MINYDNSKNVIARILEAYNLKTAKALADQWKITASVLGSRIQRNTFPADFVIKCALETGADLNWLVTGKGKSNLDHVKEKSSPLPPLNDELLEKLERLGKLRDSNVITEEEFLILKNNVLS